MSDRLLRLWLRCDVLPDRWWWVASAVAKLRCRMHGHSPMRDMCNQPEHDYCAVCNKLMPGAGG